MRNFWHFSPSELLQGTETKETWKPFFLKDHLNKQPHDIGRMHLHSPWFIVGDAWCSVVFAHNYNHSVRWVVWLLICLLLICLLFWLYFFFCPANVVFHKVKGDFLNLCFSTAWFSDLMSCQTYHLLNSVPHIGQGFPLHQVLCFLQSSFSTSFITFPLRRHTSPSSQPV